MARTPLFPRSGNLATWALAITQRIERDYAYLRQKGGTVSLSATVSNVVTDINVVTGSRVFLTPITVQAAGMIPIGLWISSKVQGQFVVTTSLVASLSCVFDYLIIPPQDA